MLRKKWVIVLAVALAAVLIIAIVAALVLMDRGNEQIGSTSSGNETSSNVGGDTSSEDSVSGGEENTTLSYAEFLAMTADQQTAFQDSFANPADYVAWFWAAYDAWEAEQDADKIIIDGDNPVIDAGDLLGGGNS